MKSLSEGFKFTSRELAFCFIEVFNDHTNWVPLGDVSFPVCLCFVTEYIKANKTCPLSELCMSSSCLQVDTASLDNNHSFNTETENPNSISFLKIREKIYKTFIDCYILLCNPGNVLNFPRKSGNYVFKVYKQVQILRFGLIVNSQLMFYNNFICSHLISF